MTELSLVADVRGLSKTFLVGFARRRVHKALDDVTLAIRSGTLYGFLGPNGAGKTTTIKIMTGLIFPDHGEVRLMGSPPTSTAAKRLLGYLPENPTFPDHLTGLEVLRFASQLLGIAPRERGAEQARVLELVRLAHAKTMQVRKYSKGMVQRLGIAQALLGDPKLIILDEPMSGLDPIGRREVKDLILDLRRAGKTVFFSTHIISDVEDTCDEVAIIVGGRIVRQGRVAELLGRGGRDLEVVAMDLPIGFSGAAPDGNSSRFLVSDDAELKDLMNRIWAAGGKVSSVKVIRYGLESIFLEEVAKRGRPPALEG